jgi:HAAS
MPMLDQTVIDRYLRDVDAYLRVDRARRDRVLAEIQGHLHDAVEAHIAGGVEPPEAVRRAIEEIGSPWDVAMQLSPMTPPVRSVQGWRRWTPIVLPAAVLTSGVTFTVFNVLYLLREGPTRGGRIALVYGLVYAAVAGGLTAATFMAIRNGDRDPAWRGAAWAFAAITGVVVLSSYAR